MLSQEDATISWLQHAAHPSRQQETDKRLKTEVSSVSLQPGDQLGLARRSTTSRRPRLSAVTDPTGSVLDAAVGYSALVPMTSSVAGGDHDQAVTFCCTSHHPEACGISVE